MAGSLHLLDDEGARPNGAPAKPRTPYATTAFKVFISYSRKDVEFVRALNVALSESGRETWVDWKDIPPTAEFLREIYSAIEAADAFVFVISPDSVRSEVCEKELRHAVRRGKRLVPVLCRELGEVAAPPEVASMHWIDFGGGRDFEGSARDLIKALDLDLRYVREHTGILTRAIEWEASGRDRSMLLRGENLRVAEEWLAQATRGDKEPKLTPLQTDFIIRSRVDGEGETKRRRRTALIAVTVTLSLAAAVLMLYWLLHVRVEMNRSQELVGAAYRRLMDGDPETAVALAAKAAETWRSDAAVEALRAALTRSQLRAVVAGHEGPVRIVEFSPDGARLLTAGDFSTPRVWDAQTGAVAKLEGHAGPVRCAGFSPDGRLIVTGGDDGTVRVWDAANGREVGEPLRLEAPVTAASFRPDNDSIILTAAADGYTALWNISSGESLPVHKYDKAVTSALFTPDGNLVLTTSEDRSADLWDYNRVSYQIDRGYNHYDVVRSAAFNSTGGLVLTADTGYGGEAILSKVRSELSKVRTDELCTLKAEPPRVSAASFSADGKMVVTTGEGGAAHVYAVTEETGPGGSYMRCPRIKVLGQREERVPGAPPSVKQVTGAYFVPNSNMVVTTYSGGEVRLWDIGGEGEPRSVRLSGHVGRVWAVAVSRDGRMLATAGQDRVARIWQTQVGGRMPMTYASRERWLLDFSRDGGSLVTAGFDGKINVWEPATGELKATVPDGQLCGASPGLSGLKLSPDGRLLAASCKDGTVTVRDLRGGAPVTVSARAAGEEEWSSDNTHLIAFSADGRWFLTARPSLKQVWEVGSWREALPLPTKQDSSSSAQLESSVLTKDGRVISVLMVQGNGGEKVWRAEVAGPAGVRWAGVLPTGGARIYGIVLSPDERILIASVGEEPLSVWDLDDGHMVASLDGYGSGSGASFSPDGRRVVTTDGKKAAVWDARTGKKVLDLPVGGANIQRADFNSDGARIVTANGDGKVSVWDAATGARLHELDGAYEQGLSSFFFSPDGSYTATVDGRARARVYPRAALMSPDQLFGLLRECPTLSLNDEEADSYLK